MAQVEWQLLHASRNPRMHRTLQFLALSIILKHGDNAIIFNDARLNHSGTPG
jgi:hypothetical protein